MIRSRLIFIITLGIALLNPPLLRAGTLADAPFRFVGPSAGWQINDSTAQPMGKDVFLVATISNTNAPLKSVIIKQF